jgi:hypothetical protein
MACLAGVNLPHVVLQSIKGNAIPQAVINYGLKVSEVNSPVVLRQ